MVTLQAQTIQARERQTPSQTAPVATNSPQAPGSQPAATQTSALSSVGPANSAPMGTQLLGTYQNSLGYPINHYVLGNGHQVLIEQRPDSGLVSLRTFIRAGSCNEKAVYDSPLYPQSPFHSGIAHLDEHCHFLATDHFAEKNSWVDRVEHLGASLNASTGYEMIQHELLFNEEDLTPMLDLHGEALLRPKYDPALILQEKRNVINECSERMAPPEAVAFSKLMELFYDRPHFQSLGNRQDVLDTSAEELKQFYQTHYTPTNMLTVISGNVAPEEVLPQLEKSFGQNPARPELGPNTVGLKLALKPGEIRTLTMQDPQLTSSSVNIAFPSPGRQNSKDRAAMEVLLHLLSDGPLSDFEQALINQRPLATAISTEMQTQQNTGMTAISFDTQEGQEQEGLHVLLDVLTKAGQQPYSGTQLDEVKGKLLSNYRRMQSHVHADTMSMGKELLFKNLNYHLDYEQLIQAVTPDDLQRVATTYLNPNRYAVVFTQPGPTRAFSSKESSIGGEIPLFSPTGSTVTSLPGATNTVVPFERKALAAQQTSGQKSRSWVG